MDKINTQNKTLSQNFYEIMPKIWLIFCLNLVKFDLNFCLDFGLDFS